MESSVQGSISDDDEAVASGSAIRADFSSTTAAAAVLAAVGTTATGAVTATAAATGASLLSCQSVGPEFLHRTLTATTAAAATVLTILSSGAAAITEAIVTADTIHTASATGSAVRAAVGTTATAATARTFSATMTTRAVGASSTTAATATAVVAICSGGAVSSAVFDVADTFISSATKSPCVPSGSALTAFGSHYGLGKFGSSEPSVATGLTTSICYWKAAQPYAVGDVSAWSEFDAELCSVGTATTTRAGSVIGRVATCRATTAWPRD